MHPCAIELRHVKKMSPPSQDEPDAPVHHGEHLTLTQYSSGLCLICMNEPLFSFEQRVPPIIFLTTSVGLGLGFKHHLTYHLVATKVFKPRNGADIFI